jgi:hypothetical protein
MHELPMMEAALFQLRAALDVDDPLQLAACLLEGAIVAAKEQGLNAARVNDIEFALNDLAAEAPVSADATIALLREDLAALQRATALPAEVIAAIRALQAKLKTRAKAIERSQYRAENAPEVPLPHPPAELRIEAEPIARKLAEAGFATPTLDGLVADPESLRYHSINEIVDELDVIAG